MRTSFAAVRQVSGPIERTGVLRCIRLVALAGDMRDRSGTAKTRKVCLKVTCNSSTAYDNHQLLSSSPMSLVPPSGSWLYIHLISSYTTTIDRPIVLVHLPVLMLPPLFHNPAVSPYTTVISCDLADDPFSYMRTCSFVLPYG